MRPARYAHVLLIPLITLALIACGGGGGASGSDDKLFGTNVGGDGGDGDGSSGGGGGGSTTPSVVVPASLGSSDEHLTIDATISDPSGSPSISWSLVSGPSASVAFDDPSAEDPTVTFPMNGDYTLRVTVTGPGGTTRQTVSVDVDDPASFVIGGRVEDGGSGVTGNMVDLRWKPAGTTLTPASTTTASGDYRFGGLIGDVDDFAVRVAAR